MLRLDEARLVAQLCRGEPEARSQFYRRYHRDVLGWCRRLGCGLVDPEDAAQDVFERALDRVGTFRGDSTLGRWLFGMTRKVLANHRRKAQRRRLWEWLAGDHAERGVSPGRDPAQMLLDSEKLALIQRCLESLTTRQREVLVLCALEERSGKEAADLLGIPQATVYTRLHSARAAFDRRAKELGLERPSPRKPSQPRPHGEVIQAVTIDVPRHRQTTPCRTPDELPYQGCIRVVCRVDLSPGPVVGCCDIVVAHIIVGHVVVRGRRVVVRPVCVVVTHVVVERGVVIAHGIVVVELELDARAAHEPHQHEGDYVSGSMAHDSPLSPTYPLWCRTKGFSSVTMERYGGGPCRVCP